MKENVNETEEAPLAQARQDKTAQGAGSKLSEAEVTAVLDAIFSKGNYEEEIELPRGHKCVFTTRTSSQALEISEYIENCGIQQMMRRRYNQLYSLCCLAMSVVSFDGDALPGKFEERLAIVREWAGPLVDKLLDRLVEFDEKVEAAYTEEQVKN